MDSSLKFSMSPNSHNHYVVNKYIEGRNLKTQFHYRKQYLDKFRYEYGFGYDLNHFEISSLF